MLPSSALARSTVDFRCYEQFPMLSSRTSNNYHNILNVDIIHRLPDPA